MVDRQAEDQEPASQQGSQALYVRRYRGRRFFLVVGIGLLVLLLVALAALWIARRPIATGFLEREFDRRGVEASYRLDRVGLRTQQISNLVIGDPRRPDLTARFAQIQTRVKWDGSVEIFRVVARGVRLRGRVIKGKVSWGQIDRMLPPPTDKPFQLPDFVLDVADSSISLATPFGPLGIALEGAGNLTGGFKGRMAAASPQLIPGQCQIHGLRANLAVAVEARRPHVDGPLRVAHLICQKSRFEIFEPRFDINSRFNEAFTRYDGKGRMAIPRLTAGDNSLSAFVGDLSFRGDPSATYGSVRLAAQRSRLATIYAERTRLAGRYRLGMTGGTFVMVGNYAAQDATLDPSMLAAVTGALDSARGTPVGPVATAIGTAIRRTASEFDADGEIRVVNFPGGGAVRIESAEVTASNGARARVSGRDGVTYYWPTSRLRVDGLIEMAGGGLPTGRVDIRQPRSGAPMSGIAEIAPYRVGGSRLELAPIRFAAASNGSTAVSTILLVDGPFEDGRVRALRVPLTGRFGSRTGVAFGTACAEISWAEMQFRSLHLGRTRLPVCPIGPAMVSQAPGGSARWGARLSRPVLAGRLGNSPLRLAASSGRVEGKTFNLDALALRLGRPSSPVIFDARRLEGNFVGRGVAGTFSGGSSTIGNVPLAMSELGGSWRVYKGDLSVSGAMTVSDRLAIPRFYPLRSEDVRFTLAGDMVRAGGSLHHPASGTKVTDVSVEHRLSTGAGQALLDVPGIRFGQGLQPEELTRLTEGVVALVQGSVTGRGRIDWSGDGRVSSSGEFSTAGMDLAAPFGPVTGLTTTVRFTDLLGLETAPGQSATIAAINPGILVENGVLRYQLLRNQLVKVERGEWPFMGGRLILRETVLNFGRPSAKRLTFEVVGLDARTFVDTLGFSGIEATGVFDGVLPMIFDESGGRIVGGRLDSRPGGGSLAYTGIVNKANLGMMGGIAFDALRDLRFRSMIVRLDGDLAGEFTTRLTIDGVALGQTRTAKFIRGFLKRLPLKLNVSIRGPFRALIATSKSFRDPRQLIQPVLPVPLDAPGIVTEVRRREESAIQTQTPPDEKIKSTPPTPTRNER